MQSLVNLLLNSLYGEEKPKDIEEKYACKSECWMYSWYDERIQEYWGKSQGFYIVKLIDDAGLEDEFEN